jgi:hypothetical protein
MTASEFFGQRLRVFINIASAFINTALNKSLETLFVHEFNVGYRGHHSQTDFSIRRLIP